MPDAIVIGAGPNGLVAANLLADRGWDVLVCEAAPTPGGAVRSAELIEPGFVNDVFSAFYPLAAASPGDQAPGSRAVRLRWCQAPLVLAHPAPDGTCPVISTDLDETAASLDAFHPGDGEAWRQLFARWRRMREWSARRLCSRRSRRFVRPRSSRSPPRREGRSASHGSPCSPCNGSVTEEFGSDAARRLFAGSALHADLAPGDVLSGFFGWILCSLGQDLGWPVPEGGAGRLTDALVARSTREGGRLECDAPVDSVIVRNGRAVGVRTRGEDIVATRAVLADVDAPRLFLDLVGKEHVPHAWSTTCAGSRGTSRCSRSTGRSNGAVPWTAPEARRAGTLHLVESVDALTESRAQISHAG